MVNLLDENRAAILAKQHDIKKAKENESIGKLFSSFLRRTDEGTMGRAVVEAVVLLTASRGNAAHVLREAAEVYNVDLAAITAQVKQEFAAKEKAKTEKKTTLKQPMKAASKPAKKAAA
jgi:ParB family chromosome partitioning protein